MQIRIVIQWPGVRSNDVLRAAWNVWRQLPCRVWGHRDEVELGHKRLALKCARWGRRSAGWDLHAHAPAATDEHNAATVPVTGKRLLPKRPHIAQA